MKPAFFVVALDGIAQLRWVVSDPFGSVIAIVAVTVQMSVLLVMLVAWLARRLEA